jgi:hypothetical protein
MRITRQPLTWQIELESPDSRKATAILNDDYEVLNMFVEGRSIFSGLEEELLEQNGEIVDQFEDLLKERANLIEPPKPILTKQDYDEFYRFIENQLNISLSRPSEPKAPEQPILQVVENSQEARILKPPSTGPFSELQVHCCQVTGLFSNGKTNLGQVISVYEPNTGLFWWVYQRYISSGIMTRYNQIDTFLWFYSLDLSADQITGFILYPFSPTKPSVRVIESCQQRYKRFEQANAMLFSQLTTHIENLEQGETSDNRFRYIPVWKYLPLEFIYPFGLPKSFLWLAKITRLKRHNGYWQMELTSAMKKKVTFMLSEDYEVLEVVEASPKRYRIRSLLGLDT